MNQRKQKILAIIIMMVVLILVGIRMVVEASEPPVVFDPYLGMNTEPKSEPEIEPEHEPETDNTSATSASTSTVPSNDETAISMDDNSDTSPSTPTVPSTDETTDEASTPDTSNECNEAEEKKQKTLAEILETPKTSTIVELIPHLKGSYDKNVDLLAHLAMGEARGGTDESQQAVMRVAVIRAFDPGASNGDGDLKSAIYWKNQWSCINDKSFKQQPDEQCLRNAKEFLAGNLLEPDKDLTAFFIGTVKRKRPLVDVYLVDDWRTSNPNDKMEVLVYSK